MVQQLFLPLTVIHEREAIWDIEVTKSTHTACRSTPASITILFLTMAPPAGGWKIGGRRRIQAHDAFNGQQLAVAFNGTDLEPTSDVSEPYATPWPDGLAPTEALRAWTVPARQIKDGNNTIVIRMEQGEPVLLSFVDVAIR